MGRRGASERDNASWTKSFRCRFPLFCRSELSVIGSTLTHLAIVEILIEFAAKTPPRQ